MPSLILQIYNTESFIVCFNFRILFSLLSYTTKKVKMISQYCTALMNTVSGNFRSYCSINRKLCALVSFAKCHIFPSAWLQWKIIIAYSKLRSHFFKYFWKIQYDECLIVCIFIIYLKYHIKWFFESKSL